MQPNLIKPTNERRGIYFKNKLSAIGTQQLISRHVFWNTLLWFSFTEGEKKNFSYLGPVLLLFWVNHIHACNQSRTSMQRNCLWTFGEHARAANLTFSVLEHWSWTLSYCDSSGWDFSLLRFTNFSVCLRPVGFYLKSSWHVFLDALMRGMVFASVHVVVVLIWVTHLCRWKLVYFWVISLESTAMKTI